MENKQSRTTELIIGIVISLIVIGIAVYWMYSVSVGAVPFTLAFGLPNNLLVNLIILVILAVVAGYAFTMVKAKR
jgi:hypothetical protein